MRQSFAAIVLALTCVVASAPVALASSYYGYCTDSEHDSAQIYRSNFADYTAARGTVGNAQTLVACTHQSSGQDGYTLVLPANIATGSVLAQLGIMTSTGHSEGFVYTPDDNSSPLGVLAYITVPGETFAVGDEYRFTISEVTGPQWEYEIEDQSTGWSYTWFRSRHISGHATQVWYQVEADNDYDLFGGQSSGHPTVIDPMQYKYQNNTAWTTLTGDDTVGWGCSGCVNPPHLPWHHGDVQSYPPATDPSTFTTYGFAH